MYIYIICLYIYNVYIYIYTHIHKLHYIMILCTMMASPLVPLGLRAKLPDTVLQCHPLRLHLVTAIPNHRIYIYTVIYIYIGYGYRQMGMDTDIDIDIDRDRA